MKPPEVTIAYLSDHIQWLPIVAQWHFSEWSHLRPGQPVQAWIEKLKSVCGHQQLPTFFVAIEEGEPVGTSMLVKQSMTTHQNLFPWVGGVYVIPCLRKKGIGERLVDRAVREACVLGFERAYLYTIDKPDFYAKRGWTTLEHAIYREQSVTIMSYKITPNHTAEATSPSRGVSS